MRSIGWVWSVISTVTGKALFENKPIRNICIYVEKMSHEARYSCTKWSS